MVDDPDRNHDTDPLADTQSSDSQPEPSASSSLTAKRRNVHTGDTLGRYELVDDVGEGGMATVYRARDKELRREVAVKVLFPHLARREEVVRRFHREARAAAGLEHRNILRVYDVGGGESEDPPYIVMELIRGHSLLGEIERRGPMLAEVVACLGAVLADALVVAHRAGIIHRDIKPANVMIGTDGRVLLADFGVARLETEDSLVTKTGALLGTPAYMSPEQAAGDTATAKSDLYSLGATMYQLATGQLPYAGSPAKVLAQIAQGAYVPAVKKRTHVGPDLSRVIGRLMAVEPNARPDTAADVARELRAIATAGGFGDPADELVAYFADPAAFVTAKTPVVVASLVKAGKQAIADGKLPRAIAIADRATALAPDDPAVNALVATVTEGGRSEGRRRILAIAGASVLVAGGAAFGAVQLLGDGPAPVAVVADAPMLDGAVDALDPARDAALDTPLADAGAVDTPILVDASVRVASIPVRRADAGVLVDAAVALPDAGVAVAVVLPPDAAAAVAKGFIVVRSDAWCDVTVDGAPRGRANQGAIEIEPGPHTVRCEQSGMGKSWTQQVTVAPGQRHEVRGSLLTVAVRFAVDATVDGKTYTAGQSVQLRGDRYQVQVDGRREWVSITRACEIRATPQINCY